MLATANTDFIQATIEIFGTIIMVVLGVMFKLVTGNRKKSERALFCLLMLVGLSLLVDSGWYIYDGNTSILGRIVNHVSNFAVFLCNPLMLTFAAGYVTHLIKENGGHPKRIFIYSALGFSALALLVPISNIFYKWLYYIDDQNVYHRLSGWFVYLPINCVVMFILVAMIITYKRCIKTKQRIAVYVFFAAPFVGAAIQTVSLGISFIQLGSAVGCLVVLLSYLVEWVKHERVYSGISEEKKNFWLIECVFILMILCISASIISCAISLKIVSNKSSEQNSVSLTYMVSETIVGSLSEPINVSRTMAKSPVVTDALKAGLTMDAQTQTKLIEYMQRLKDEYGYQMFFTASNITGAYYTYDGFSRYMDGRPDRKDAWFSEFRKTNEPFELNIDFDKDNNMARAVFVNMRVTDETGKCIGVCGVAMSIDSLMEILNRYEREYSLAVTLANREGLIQVGTYHDLIEKEYIDDLDVSNETEEVYYVRDNDVAILTKYLEELGWYLVVEDMNPDKLNVGLIVLPSMIIYAVGIALLLGFSFLFSYRELRRNRELRVSRRQSETDGLTGLKNRYSMDKHIEELEKIGVPNNLSVIMIDINGLKSVNDTIGHDAGDELIRGAADCMAEVFQDKGEIYRIGGDEFIIMSQCPKEEVDNLINRLEGSTGEWYGNLVKELTVSVGVSSASDNPGSSVADLLKLADALMYQDKNAYYQRTGKKRRQQ